MTTYLFGSNYSDSPIEKSFENDCEAFEYVQGMTDGPDRVSIWKKVGNVWHGWVQEGWEDGEWLVDEKVTFTRWMSERIAEVEAKRRSLSYDKSPSAVIGKGGQLTAFKQALDFYTKHFITHRFN